MPTTIRLPGALTMPNLSRLLKVWPHDEPAIELDFRDQRWVEPAGTVALTCLVHAASNRGQEVTVNVERCQNAVNWARMGFFRNLGLPEPGQRDRAQDPGGRFSEIAVVDDIDETDGIAAGLVAVANPSERARLIYLHVVTEALNNVAQHSGAVGYCASQYYPANNRVRFAIGDCGVGLFENLRDHRPETDTDAILLALKVGIKGRSRVPPGLQPRHLRNRGVGLSAIRRLVVGNGGTLTIRSGVGRYTGWVNGASIDGAYRWPGTLIDAEMPRNTVNRDFRAAMLELSAELRKIERASRRRGR